MILSFFLIGTIFFVLIPTITIPVVYSQTSGNSLPIIFVTTSETAAPHQIPLKAIRQGSTSEITQVSTFNIDFTNVIQIPQNGSIIVLSAAQNPSFQITSARLQGVSEVIIDLPKTALNTFSLPGIPPGVYTLDVIGQQENIQGAYETIIVILSSPSQPISEQTEKVVRQRIAYEIVNVGSVFLDKPPPEEPSIICDFDSGHKIIDGKCVDLRDDEGRPLDDSSSESENDKPRECREDIVGMPVCDLSGGGEENNGDDSDDNGESGDSSSDDDGGDEGDSDNNDSGNSGNEDDNGNDGDSSVGDGDGGRDSLFR
jgi:hypothetical protein